MDMWILKNIYVVNIWLSLQHKLLKQLQPLLFYGLLMHNDIDWFY